MHIAVIGSGISGSLVARILSAEHDVTIFEANDYPGGHAKTVDVSAFGERYSVDTGFMVFNRRTYPNFCRLLHLLNIRSRASDMSFSVRCAATGLEYQGSSLNGLFAQRTNVLRPSFLRMLRDILRFNQEGMRAAASGELRDGRTVGEFLQTCEVGEQFANHYLVPMASAIWSCQPESIADFPAEFMVGFFANHGLMQIKDRPQWRTIVGGSRTYVEALLEPIRDRLHLQTPVSHVFRREHDVTVSLGCGTTHVFDQVVFASHADQTLEMLADATDEERDILGAFPYHPNEAVLHTDTRLLPSRRRAWASWNYRIATDRRGAATVTYDLSRLQGIDSPTPLLLTLNDTRSVDSAKVLREFTFYHPGYSQRSIRGQTRFSEINGRHRTHFCGAYWGYGFHEDGVKSALAVAKKFDLDLSALRRDDRRHRQEESRQRERAFAAADH
ncbi:MAG: FAD-dependent oxidoreductase [Pirellulales bacterium]|nr:FAD-dependent oxidoreductase [Pirellulales bacterium]